MLAGSSQHRLIVSKSGHMQERIDAVIQEVEELGYEVKLIEKVVQSLMKVISDQTQGPSVDLLSAWLQVADALQKRCKLTSRNRQSSETIVTAHARSIGSGQKFCMMAGPCAVESEEQVITTAHAVKACGATFLRGGAFKPRSSPYEFQGLGEAGLKILAQAKRETGLGIITEVLAEKDVELVAQYADILQIGTRNSQNFALLMAVAKIGKPVLLKRGMSMKIEEWLLAAEYILSNGNPHVLLCERGIRTFETYTRNTLDLSAVVIAKKESHLPVIVDPSQGCGRAELIISLCKAAVAVGADGLLVEVHPNPERALSDGHQQIDLNTFKELVQAIEPFLKAAGRNLS